MINTGKLAGRTAFITGASRGIGKAIALKLAKDGANVVIAAKTVEPHPSLPGTIYTAAKEVEAAGGKCLPCVVDIRYEEQVQKAAEQAVKEFGGIDILVNNASAISLTGTLETPMKRYDLMNSINGRGTYLTSKVCLPYLKKGTNPHILNISPPLNLSPHWFKNHVAYTMAKYGMSMCVLGMAEEFRRDQIAVNALWPLTAISTAAMKMLGGEDIDQQCRKDSIMADAAYAVLTRDSKNFTGNFYIDEEVLREVGVTDFEQYAVKPGATLMPDFFLDNALSEQYKNISAQKKKEGVPTQKPAESQPPAAGAAAGSKDSIPVIFDTMKTILNDEIVQKTGAVFAFNISGPQEGKWFLDLKNGQGACGKGEPPANADVVFTMKDADFVKMFSGQLKATTAYMSGKLKLKGDIGKAMKLERLMQKLQSKL